MSFRRRTTTIRLAAAGAAVLALLGVGAALPLSSAAAPGLGQLTTQFSQQQTRQQSLSASLAGLGRLIGSLDGQIALVRSREATVATQLASGRAALAAVQGSLHRERQRLAQVRVRLTRARLLLSRQLVSNYESDAPGVITVVLEAHGFAELLDRISFLHDAERQQQAIIHLARTAKAQADSAARQLARLEVTDRQITQAALLRVRALAGMNSLLDSRQAALHQARAAQQTALQASRSRGAQLRGAISRVQAQQAAAQRAAAALAAAQQAPAPQPSVPSVGAPSSVGLGPSGGWAIPYAIVLCESGGQNLPPNSAGASGYYQIIPSTWSLYGGSGPAAYLTGKSEQDAVATRIWNGGAGASNWVCAGIVGIH